MVPSALSDRSETLTDSPPSWAAGVVEGRLELEVASGARGQIADATLTCFGRYGIAKTTLDDVAREARCSRATIYRLFPGGKDEVSSTVVESEVGRLFAAIAARLESTQGLEELLVAVTDEAVQRIGSHPALGFILAHEPDIVLPRVAFSQFDTVLALSSAFLAPYLRPYLSDEDARRTGEWITRVVISYLICPVAPPPGSTAARGLPDEEHLRRVVRSFVLPGIRALQASTGTLPPPASPSNDQASLSLT